MNDVIEKIIAAGVQAPSGENCQPWRFEVDKSGVIYIYVIPERDTSLYSWGQRASYFAHGALLENMRIAAETSGYSTQVDLFPEPKNALCVACVRLERVPIPVLSDSLAACIPKRATNRRPYALSPLPLDAEKRLLGESKSYVPAAITLIKDKQTIHSLALAASVNERILFENKKLHDFFYDHITWTTEEDERKRLGFYIKTFELPPPAEHMFRLCKNYTYARALGMVGLPRFIARQNASLYASCAAIGIITIPTLKPEEFLHAGMLFQHVWLRAVKEQLSVQPLAGMIYLALRVFSNEASDFSSTHQKLILDSYAVIRRSIGNEHAYIPMMFRIGESNPPSARALRLAPTIASYNQ